MATRKSKPIVDAAIQRVKLHLSKFQQENPDVCWEWMGAVSSGGYGKIYVTAAGKTGAYSVHRISMLIKQKNDDPEACVIHSCDNPRCFNPSHLSWGTHKDNMQDKVRKGRTPDYSKIVARGEKHGSKNRPERVSKGTSRPNAALNPDKVLEIRKSNDSYSILAERYGVSKATICRARTGHCWKHVSPSP